MLGLLFLRSLAADSSGWGEFDPATLLALSDAFDAIAEGAEELAVMSPGPGATKRAGELRDADRDAIARLP